MRPENFSCTINLGPHHGEHDCIAHGRRENWRYGRLRSWIALEVYDAWHDVFKTSSERR